jgi:dsRNA-specific ribonuclease
MNINDLINTYVETKALKESLNGQIKTCNEKMASTRADIMEQMATAGITKAASDKASCTMREVTHPAIEDWDAFYKHVAATGQFELLHKRLSSAAFKERWEAGEVVPGTSSTKLWELSVVRRK